MLIERSIQLSVRVSGLVWAIVGLVACAKDSASNAGGSGGSGAKTGGGSTGGSKSGTGGMGSGGVFDGPIGDLPEGFNEMYPGGDTICARGTPFSFFVRPGTVNRVVVDFRGGGGCWDEATCRPGATIGGTPYFVDAASMAFGAAAGVGIYDFDNPENPVRDWHFIHVPYCTGDVHQGNADVTYSDYTIHHRGAVNARAVLDWLYKAAPDPEKIFVTGCSAGSYGSILWGAHIREHYGNAKVVQFGDSGIGAGNDGSDFYQKTVVDTWNSLDALPVFVPASEFATQPLLFKAVSNQFPDMRLSVFNTAFDNVQSVYYSQYAGGTAYDWFDRMKANVAEMAKLPNFRSFTSPGSAHCTIPYPSFYTDTSGGVRVRDWLNDLLEGDMPDSVTCEPNCGAPNTAP